MLLYIYCEYIAMYRMSTDRLWAVSSKIVTCNRKQLILQGKMGPAGRPGPKGDTGAMVIKRLFFFIHESLDIDSK